jgi:hypothetical protein
MLKPADIGREFAYPLSNLSVLFSALFVFLMLEFAAFGGILGLFLGFLVLPALFRYLMRILDSRSKGQDPGPLVVEDFMWFYSAWSLFLIVHLAVLIYATYILGSLYGLAAMLAVNILLAVVIPASLAVLAITRSPLECLNPRSVVRLIRRTGTSYWILPAYFLAAAFAVWWLSTLSLPDILAELFSYYLILVFFALTGAVVQPHQFHKEVNIHQPAEPDQEAVHEILQKERMGVLNHAYGFISRGNRAGGFKHIRSWLERDPEPDNSWSWFFDQMMRWENKEPALLLGQSYLSRLLHNGDYSTAVKVILRCRYVNESFLPLPEDRDLAREAAEHCGNTDLIDTLERS